MKTHKWNDVKKELYSDDRRAKLDREVEAELLEMDMREVRELLGKTQQEIAQLAEMSQGELSKFERRSDRLVSTLRKFVEALGGELEVFAAFGERRVRLRV